MHGDAANQKGVPSAPFVTDTKSWVALGLKRAIMYAVQNGMTRVAWANGEQANAGHYDLTKTLKTVKAMKSGDKVHVFGTDHSDNSHDFGTHVVSELPGVVGKELAEKIANQANAE